MKVLNDKGECTTAATNGYYLGEQPIIDLAQENNILKQRCAEHATPKTCKLCSFNCVYRKHWGY